MVSEASVLFFRVPILRIIAQPLMAVQTSNGPKTVTVIAKLIS